MDAELSSLIIPATLLVGATAQVFAEKRARTPRYSFVTGAYMALDSLHDTPIMQKHADTIKGVTTIEHGSVERHVYIGLAPDEKPYELDFFNNSYVGRNHRESHWHLSDGFRLDASAVQISTLDGAVLCYELQSEHDAMLSDTDVQNLSVFLRQATRSFSYEARIRLVQ